MSTRQTHDPFALRDPNILGAKSTLSPPKNSPGERMSPSSRQQRNGSDTLAREDLPYDVLDEDDTQDSFMKRMIREENSLTHSRTQSEDVGRMQAFKKARTRPRSGLTIDNLTRHTDVANPAPPEVRSKSSLGSVSSGGRSDPPLNVPHDWARKAKRNPQWIRRIKTDHPGMYTEEATNGNVNWLAEAADTPLPTVEIDDSPLSRRGSNRGTPASLVRKTDKHLESEDELDFSADFDAANIIASTPAPRRSNKLDDIKQREIDAGLESSIYPTPPRERSRQHTPQTVERVAPTIVARHTAANDSFSHPAEQNIHAPSQEDKEVKVVPAATDPTNDPRRSRSPKKHTHKTVQTSKSSRHEDKVEAPKPSDRPVRQREDSRDILRRLSRTPSATPSPGASRLPKPAPSLPLKKDSYQKHQMADDRPGPGSSSRISGSTTNLDGSEQRDKILLSSKTKNASPHGTAAVESEQLRVATGLLPPEENTSATSPDGREPKTPVVTGGWVDTTLGLGTPRPSILDDAIRTSPRKSPPKRADVNKEQEALAESSGASVARQQRLPSSALTAILDEARARPDQQSDDALGEATINSLQDLVGDDSQHGLTSDREDDTIEELELPISKPRNAAEKQRLDEILRIKKMNQKINKLQGDMHSMHRGFNNIEKGLTQPAPDKSVSLTAPLTTTGISHGEVSLYNPRTVLVEGIRQMFWVYRKDETSFKRCRVGPGFWVLLLCAIILYIPTEVVACMIFCRPVLAYSMEGYGLYPDAPEMPYVIPTMLLRPLRPLWRPLVHAMLPLSLWLWNFVLYCFQEGVFGSATPDAVLSATPAATTVAYADWSLEQDGYL